MNGPRRFVSAAILASLLAPAVVRADVEHAACTTPTSDRRIGFDDAVDVALDDGVLRALRWTTARNTRDGRTLSHAAECTLTIDASSFAIARTRRGSLATSRDDRDCRVEVLGRGSQLALVPHCRSGCVAGAHFRALALDTATGMCRPLDDRLQGKFRP